MEKALSDELIPSKQEIVRDNTQSEIEDMMDVTHSILDARMSGVSEQLDELKGLRGKNQDVIEHMMEKVKCDKENFEKGLQRFQALRSVFSQQTNILFTYPRHGRAQGRSDDHPRCHGQQPFQQGHSRCDEQVFQGCDRKISASRASRSKKSST